MTTFRPRRRRRTRRTHPATSGGTTVAEHRRRPSRTGPLPFRISAFDGSTTGPADAPGLQINNRRALTYVLTAPGDLGLVRAYVSGDIDFIGTHSADPYELLKLMDDGLHLRTPVARRMKDMVIASRAQDVHPGRAAAAGGNPALATRGAGTRAHQET